MGRSGRASRAGGAALALVALLGACTGDDEPSGPTTTASEDEVVEGGTLRLGLGGPLQIDPAAANLGSPSELLVLDVLHDGLTRLDPDGVPVAAVAEGWTADATLTTWVFTLDAEASFTSGRDLTSADVVASLERVARGGDASLAALRLETVQGFRAFAEGSADRLAGLSAPDPDTVQIVLDTAMSALPAILAAPQLGIVDVASLDEAVAAGADADALGDLDLSGSWAIAEAGTDRLELERRPGAAGHLDAIELRSYDDAAAAYDAFDDSDVDWALVPVERFADAIDDHGDDHFAPFHAELFFGLRVTSATLGNLELRKAIAAAVDREAIVEAVYPDLADPLATIVPAGLPGHDPAVCGECGHDPERARALLAAAFPDGAIPTVTIDFDESAAQSAMAELVAEDLGAVGIPTSLAPRSLDDYKRHVVSGAQEMFSFGWIGGYVSSDAYLGLLFGSAADDNLTGYRSDGVDNALAAARGSLDAPAAAAQWAAAELQVLSEAVVVPIAQFRTQAVAGARVRGLEHAVDGSVDWAAVWVADGR